MIRWLAHNEINKQQWDSCIHTAANGNVYALSWYLDAVHPNWEALVVDDYECVMPLTGNRKFGVSYLFTPFFVQQLGVFSSKNLTENDIKALIDSIPSKYRFAEIKLNEGNSAILSWDSVTSHRNIILDLNPDYNNIASKYNNNTKRNLAKARKGVVLSQDVDVEEVVRMFRENKGKYIKHWKNKEYQTFCRLVGEALCHERCFLYGAYLEGDLIGGAVFMQFSNRITFLFSGVDESHKDKHALTLILDEVIRRYAGNDAVLDFEGSDNDNLARFYKGFGGVEIPYPELKINHLGKILRIIKK